MCGQKNNAKLRGFHKVAARQISGNEHLVSIPFPRVYAVLIQVIYRTWSSGSFFLREGLGFRIRRKSGKFFRYLPADSSFNAKGQNIMIQGISA